MEGYLGETEYDIADSIYHDYTTADWAMLYIESYGQIDGSHHKLWVLDQVARILKGTKVKVKLARWSNGHEEWRFTLDEPSKEYLDWVEEMKDYDEESEEYNYDYDEGVAP